VRWLAPVALLAVLTSGCVFVAPVPTAYHPAGSRRNLTDATATRFVPNTTTVDEVVLGLGGPDEAASDASSLTYRWERVNLHLVWGWAIPGPYGGAGQGWDRTYSHLHPLNFTFDKSGVLQDVTTTNLDRRITKQAE